VCLELTCNYGTETQDDFKYHAGNGERDGFGHVAFNTDDVYEACNMLEQKGAQFRNKPEGRMKMGMNFRGQCGFFGG